jgi:DNA helicase-2/ATP-dependent DNA helicase PcrA
MAFTLNDDRKRLLEAEKHALVTGGPGSGKTTLALLKAQKRINDGLLMGQSILFSSFSRAAVARIVEASKIQIPNQVQKRLSIQTFHSFFWEVLRAHGYLLGAPRHLRLLLPHDECATRNGQEGGDSAWEAKREELFCTDGLVAFDLFAPKVHELLGKSQKLRDLFSSRHPLIIVDEAQDTAEDQWHSVRLLAKKSQLICLADLEQQIYDFRPGVSADRVKHIMAALDPLRVDLAGENHRSPDSEIVKFGNDILLGTPRGSKYKGASRMTFRPDRASRDSSIRSSVAIVSDRVEKTTGEGPENIAILATWGKGVNTISKALTGDGSKPIAHRVMIDEFPVLLASRMVGFLIEPRAIGDRELSDLAEALMLAASVFKAKGGSGALKTAVGLETQAVSARAGHQPRARTAAHALLGTLRKLRECKFSGNPIRDWIVARKLLSDSGCAVWADIAGYAEQLIVFQRGKRIAASLSDLWQTQGNYAHARNALDTALALIRIAVRLSTENKRHFRGVAGC